jgi:hypothetical protein
MRRAAAMLLGTVAALALLAAASAGVSAARIEVQPRRTAPPPDGDAKEVRLFLRSPTEHRSILELHVFPGKGVAVAHTYRVEGISGRGVNYAIAIPPAPFDGALDLDFPGLGEIVGTVTADEPQGAAAQAKLCERSYPTEPAKFVGALTFRAAGEYGRWESSHAQVEVVLGCGAEPQAENGPDALFAHAAENTITLSGPAPIRFFAHGEVRHRFVEFIAWGGRASDLVEFAALDREWLPGEVATERWAKKSPASLKKTVTLVGGARLPASATFTPPAPFFGKGTYRRRTGRLTGSLGVNFLGLKLHLTPSPLRAALADEDPPRRSK